MVPLPDDALPLLPRSSKTTSRRPPASLRWRGHRNGCARPIRRPAPRLLRETNTIAQAALDLRVPCAAGLQPGDCVRPGRCDWWRGPGRSPTPLKRERPALLRLPLAQMFGGAQTEGSISEFDCLHCGSRCLRALSPPGESLEKRGRGSHSRCARADLAKPIDGLKTDDGNSGQAESRHVGGNRP